MLSPGFESLSRSKLMKITRRVLRNVAKNYRADPDEILIHLWDKAGDRFDYLRNENSTLKNKDVLYVKKILDRLSGENKRESRSNKSKSAKPIKIIYKVHDFSTIGRKIDSEEYLRKDEILTIYNELVSDFESLDDPIQPAGVKDESLLDAAIFHPLTSYEHIFKYPTVETSAAALMYALSHNHAFYNGNKRTAIVAMMVFLDRHNICLICNEDELFRISLRLADHKMVDAASLYPDAEIYELAKWIHLRSKVMKKGERPITLRKLKQILTHFGCTILGNGKVQRAIPVKPLFGFPRPPRILSSTRAINHIISDGRDVDTWLVKSIREDLELTPEKGGVDSEIFYEMAKLTPSDFITKYKTLLKRLSKV